MFLIMSFQYNSTLLSILLPDDNNSIYLRKTDAENIIFIRLPKGGAWQKFGNNSTMMLDKYNTVKPQHNL